MFINFWTFPPALLRYVRPSRGVYRLHVAPSELAGSPTVPKLHFRLHPPVPSRRHVQNSGRLSHSNARTNFFHLPIICAETEHRMIVSFVRGDFRLHRFSRKAGRSLCGRGSVRSRGAKSTPSKVMLVIAGKSSSSTSASKKYRAVCWP
ncbi:hypothetical protein GLOTRDRAFT_51814 [Gloeophyllum trabeum ATCC 11539]|uniref:Uncharacterized protein n=1 Tax=Gloeophyllum trabeum (strain ATCC 11539 / FP-39264 / Madison 617) TaxID=670483 RepID=S7QL49_GLOTA|nr:uncharacterized protein GLOTRDRAFT_51814 [Gloeophyllum trabeum ATCC 11539]EPQ60002.1 hypothetical protein GLOTRDRAFT_51814 [Gloeophyllum trabeum ATCC 11539]